MWGGVHSYTTDKIWPDHVFVCVRMCSYTMDQIRPEKCKNVLEAIAVGVNAGAIAHSCAEGD